MSDLITQSEIIGSRVFLGKGVIPPLQESPVTKLVRGKECAVYPFGDLWGSAALAIANHVLMMLDDGMPYWVPIEHLFPSNGETCQK